MKTLFRSSFELKTGTISRSEARSAAREVKQARDSRRGEGASAEPRVNRDSAAWERYLGHFGGSSSTKRGGVRKKGALRKSSARKKSTGRKKSSSPRKKTSSGRKNARR